MTSREDSVARWFEEYHLSTRDPDVAGGGNTAPTLLPRPTAVERGRGS